MQFDLLVVVEDNSIIRSCILVVETVGQGRIEVEISDEEEAQHQLGG